MNNVLKTVLIILLIVQLFLIVNTVKRKKFSIRYASLWFFAIFLMMFVVIYPNIIFKISELFGFEKASNMIFLLGFFFLFYIIFILTSSLSIQNNKIKLLIQEISILKEKLNKINNKN